MKNINKLSISPQKLIVSKNKKKDLFFKRIIAITLIMCTFITTNIFVNTFAAGGNMDKGFVFFAPETDVAYHSKFQKDVLVNGTEFFVSWAQIEPKEGQYDWTEIEKYAREYSANGKKITFRISTASFSPNDSPAWLYENYNVRRITDGYWANFENGLSGYEILSGGKMTSDMKYVVSGNTSVTGKGQILASGSNDVSAFNSGSGYNVGFDFFSFGNAVIKVAVKNNNGTIETIKQWNVSSQERGSRNCFVSAGSLSSGSQIVFISESSSVSLDNINISSAKSGFHVGNLAFPNYLDPVFTQKLSNMIIALAKKYKNDSRVSSVCIGGFGRWEELTLGGDVGRNTTTSMWKSLGFDQEKYLAHIKKIVDVFDAQFRPAGKPLFMCSIGFPTEGLFDQNYIDWKVTNYLGKKGIGIKYNGWQAMQSEWGSDATAIFYQINRFKHNTNVNTYFEQGAQINSVVSEVVGHPLSMYNRAIIDQVDYYWMYFKDMITPFTSRYMQYASEAAGSALVTKMYNYPDKVVYNSLIDKNTYNLYNQWMGLFQTNSSVNADSRGIYRIKPVGEYTVINGKKSMVSPLKYSIDDRQKYNGMYGGVINIEYLDDQKGEFTVYCIYEGNRQKVLGNVSKTGTGKWLKKSFYDPGFLAGSKNSGNDLLTEINISKGATISSIGIDYVPAREWKENEVKVVSINNSKGKNLQNSVTINIPAKDANGISGLGFYVSPQSSGYVSVKATVRAIRGSEKIFLTTKEYFMPENADLFYLPTANAPQGTTSFEVEISSLRGNAYLATDFAGKVSYSKFSYSRDISKETEYKVNSNKINVSAKKPFAGLSISGNGNIRGTISRVMVDDKVAVDVAAFSTSISGGPANVYFEPQPAGRYIVRFTQDSNASSVKLITLQRLTTPNLPKRYTLGENIVAKSGSGWAALQSLSKPYKNSDGVTGYEVTDINPTLERSGVVKFASDKIQTLNIVIKNETSAGISKFYWKTSEANYYSEKNSVIIPIVPNDNQYREYSWPIGWEENWTGEITGMKFIPAGNETDTGNVEIRRLEIHDSNKIITGHNQKLNIQEIKASSFIDSKVVSTPYFPEIEKLINFPEIIKRDSIKIVGGLINRPTQTNNTSPGDKGNNNSNAGESVSNSSSGNNISGSDKNSNSDSNVESKNNNSNSKNNNTSNKTKNINDILLLILLIVTTLVLGAASFAFAFKFAKRTKK